MFRVSITGWSSSPLMRTSTRGLQKHIKYQKTRLAPKIKRREAPNPHKNTAGVFHSGLRLPVNLTKHFDRHVDVINDSAYHPPFLVHDYIMDTSDYILEPFNAGKGVVMNRNHVLNSLDFNGIDHFAGLVKKYMNEPSAASVTFFKARGDVWSTGTNYIEIYENLDTKEGRKKIFDYFRKLYTAINDTKNGSSLLTPFIDGLCMGSAASFAVNCPATACGPKADLCWPETAFGFHPHAGAMHILNTLPRNIGVFMALTGSRLTGHSIVEAGLGNFSFTEELIQSMQIALDERKYRGFDEGYKVLRMMDGYSKGPFELLPHLDVIERCFGKPTVPEIIESLEHEALTDDWAKHQLKKLRERSPLSLVITLEALKRSTGKSIHYVLKQDFRLTTRFLDSHDFREGVKKLIVEGNKNGKPVWEYKTPEEVPQSVVDAFFAPTGDEDTEFIISGHDDKLNLPEQVQEFDEYLSSLMAGENPVPMRLSMTRDLSPKDKSILPQLSNERPNLHLDMLTERDKYYTEPKWDFYLDDAYQLTVDKKHYDGPRIWKNYNGPEAGEVWSAMEEVDADAAYNNARPVSEHGKWRQNEDIYDCFNEIKNLFNVLQHPYPEQDSIIRDRTVSKEEQQKSEDAFAAENDIAIPDDTFIPPEHEDVIPYQGKMRFPPYEKLPQTLEEADKLSLSDDDYTTAESDGDSSGISKAPLPKDQKLVDPSLARWDSDF
mmetsp:Transcript_33932/g.57970  ORF Transcript_33932/g.57970 Transcript_33932/m.57970 type:complete len:718 (-) Transcript_33932:70-2223(-)